jgi:hypothetical protein
MQFSAIQFETWMKTAAFTTAFKTVNVSRDFAVARTRMTS